MTSASRIPPLTTLPDAARQHALDDATVQRLRRRLRGREVLPAIFRHPRKYAEDDVRRAIAFECGRHAPLPTRDDLYTCACGRSWISQAALDAHVRRDHGEVSE